MSGEWGAWKTVDVNNDKRIWRFCDLDHDGPDNTKKGFCYISQECRYRSTIFGNQKEECRNAPLFCAFTDIACMDRYEIFSKVIVNKEKVR